MNPTSLRALEEEAIEATAAAWLAQADDLSPAQAAEFARWRAADPRHAAAVDRLQQTHALLGNLPRLRREPALLRRLGSPPARVSVGRFRTLAMLTGLAAAVIVAILVWRAVPDASAYAHRHATAAHGYERAMLPDGSVVELNANSAVEVRFTADQRFVRLVHGEAHFVVAKNPARPFIVSAGNIQVRAVGTAFNVRLDPANVDVLVTEGKVALEHPAAAPAVPAETATTLVAGQRAMVGTRERSKPRVETVAPAVVGESLAWQAPRLAFVDTPLEDVVARFNVRNRIQVVIGDPALARRPVGGHFRADYVEAFVRLLEATGDIAAEHPDADHIVLRPSRH